MSKAQIQLWYQSFKGGWESLEIDPRSGRPSTSRTLENVQRMRAAINENWQLNV
jgi:hypothetical protein